MTRPELADMDYDRLPWRLRLAGREVVSRVVEDAVRLWPVPVLRQCDAGEAAVVGSFLARSLKRRSHQYGTGIILTLILSALISEAVKILLRWWLERREHREAMMEMQAP
jgi:hypothetical protein